MVLGSVPIMVILTITSIIIIITTIIITIIP